MDFVLGLIVGLLLAGLFRWNPWTGKGVFKIDHSDPNKDIYRLEIDRLDEIAHKRRIILKIDHKADLSQK